MYASEHRIRGDARNLSSGSQGAISIINPSLSVQCRLSNTTEARPKYVGNGNIELRDTRRCQYLNPRVQMKVS